MDLYKMFAGIPLESGNWEGEEGDGTIILRLIYGGRL